MGKDTICGVVILNYNSHDLTVGLAEQFDNLESVNYICVVDNNSRDSFDNDFNSQKIHYIKNTVNSGYNAGNNLGLRFLIEEKNCDVVVISNPDIEFEEDIIQVMIDALEADSDLAIVSTKRYGADHDAIPQYMVFPTWKESMRNCFFLTRRGVETKKIYEQNKIINGAQKIVYVDSVPGAFFAIRASFLKKIGYLYEGTFLYGEENIIGRQVLNEGLKAGIINTAEYCHNHKRTKFANNTMFSQDRVSLLKYYKLFNLLNPIQYYSLKIATILGGAEYKLGYRVYHLIYG